MASDSLNDQAVSELLNSAFRYAVSLCSHRETAEDLVHESWVKVVSRYGPNPDKALLFRVIRNLYIDQVRHRTKFKSEAFDETQHEQHHSSDPSVLASHDSVLADGLRNLRDLEREILFLWVFEGYTAAEIADLSGQSRGTVLSQIHRAKAKLKRHLDKEKSPQLAVVDGTRKRLS